MSSSETPEKSSSAVVDLPASKFWPVASSESKGAKTSTEPGRHGRLFPSEPRDSDWQEELGLHPSSPVWNGVTKMMIRNVPARCSQSEIEELLQSVTANFKLQMPRSSERKCKGYAFVEGDPEVVKRLAEFLWTNPHVPSRRSTRPLKIHPAEGFQTDGVWFAHTPP